MKKTVLLTTCCAALMASTSASAASLLFDFDGVDASDDISFMLDSEPTPDQIVDGFFFQVDGVDLMFGDGTTSVGSVAFGSDAIGGGLGVFNPGLIYNLFGPQLYTGTEATPVFSVGSFDLLDASDGGLVGTLTIGSAVPEPATWAMMLLGFFGIGAMMRRKPSVRSVSVSYT